MIAVDERFKQRAVYLFDLWVRTILIIAALLAVLYQGASGNGGVPVRDYCVADQTC